MRAGVTAFMSMFPAPFKNAVLPHNRYSFVSILITAYPWRDLKLRPMGSQFLVILTRYSTWRKKRLLGQINLGNTRLDDAKHIFFLL